MSIGQHIAKALNYTNAGQNSRLRSMYLRSVLEYSTPKKLLNALRTEISYRRKSLKVGSKPFILLLEPLYYCNLDCPLCDRQIFPDARKNDAGMMSLELYDRILDQVGPYLFQCQIFGQGEPLMNWKLTREIIARTHARHIFTMISTNATLITAQKAEELVASDLDHLVVAIDGVTQGPYETYRVGGNVQAALDGLRMVVAARSRRPGSRLAIEWQYLTHSRNLHEVEPARQLAAELGIGFRTAPIRGMEWDKALEDQWLSPGDERMQPGQYVNDFPCYFLWRSLVLNSNGKVARCLVYQNVAQYADLNKMSVMEAYNHPSVQAARSLFGKAAMTQEAPSPCNSCGHYERQHGPRPTKRRPTDMSRELPRVLLPRDKALRAPEVV
jgi:sulfatase maturation enzyme AslB (radical SAM superfamily)